ncbi:MAG: UDP-N-acetylmuramoyl-L-alanyl-D-glutamate--2,6-diaminopimelate ligase [Ignavibacteriaceae bacterium]
MELTKLLNSVKVINVIGEVQRKDVANIVYDSRKVEKNSVFVAIKGFNTDGHKYILQAISKGAIAIILEDNKIVPDEIFVHEKIAKILVYNSRAALAEVSNYFFKEPSKKLSLIGITGTNGKTTTSFYIKSILEESGSKVGLLGTIANYIGSREIKSSLTTPEANDVNALLLEMVNENCKYAVMEVSSHALALNRVKSLNFSVGVFTNITSDHLDFHKNFETYLNAKKILFDNLGESAFGVYNSDDSNSTRLIEDCKAMCHSYGMTSNADFIIKNISYDLNGTNFQLEYKGEDYSVSTSLIGEFNAYNATAAIAVTTLLGINFNTALNGIKKTKQVPGRFEVFGNKNIKVIVDYSHTADSLEKALQAVHNIVKNKFEVYTVFGCGGNRDKTKRPIMGKIASEMSDRVFITSDNPRNENPFEIIEDIKKGISKNNFEVVENREQAIKAAIKGAKEKTVVLIAGKGHENYQEINGIRNHFSDKETAQKYL